MAADITFKRSCRTELRAVPQCSLNKKTTSYAIASIRVKEEENHGWRWKKHLLGKTASMSQRWQRRKQIIYLFLESLLEQVINRSIFIKGFEIQLKSEKKLRWMLFFLVLHAEQKGALPPAEDQDEGMNFFSVCFICVANYCRWYFLYPESSAVIGKVMQWTTCDVSLELFLPKD